VTITSTIFFASWGYWNILFYSHNNLMYSCIAGVVVGVINTIWVCQMIYYTKFYKKKFDTISQIIKILEKEN